MDRRAPRPRMVVPLQILVAPAHWGGRTHQLQLLAVACELCARGSSVTYVTSFWAQWRNSTPCYVKVAHERSKHAPLGHSKVRVDSLYVRRAEQSAIAFARSEQHKGSKTTLWKQWGDFAHACELEAARRVRDGHQKCVPAYACHSAVQQGS